MARRILLVEDDGLTVDIVSGILAAKGYEVDTASDGVSAIGKLCKGGYDLALIDYHLPEVDGYASARVMGSMAPIAERPKLVAITGDTASLSAREASGAVFDAVLSKPFDPQTLCRLIERMLSDPDQDAAAEAALDLWRARGLAGRPKAFAAPPATPKQAQAIRGYFDLVADPATADVVLLLDADGLKELTAALRRGGPHLLPTVDLTGARRRELDASFNPHDPASWSEVADRILAFREKSESLTPAARFSADPATRLMTRLFVSGRALEPVPDPNDRRFFVYSGAVGGEEITALAEGLAAEGLLTASFAERFHACRGCASHRLNVREECASCRSPDLNAVKLLRHFRCGTVTPEDECRKDGWFTCPGCSRALGRYGADYERVGEAQRCHDCGASNDAAAIGFVCLDCGAHADAGDTVKRDVYAYALTARAARLLTTRRPAAAPVEARSFVTAAAMAGRRAILAELRFTAAEFVIATDGPEAYETLRRDFMEGLAATFGEDMQVVEGRTSDFLVVTDRRPEQFCSERDALLRTCEARLRQTLGAQIAILEAA